MEGQGQWKKNVKTRRSKEKWENNAKRGEWKNKAKSKIIGKAGPNRKHRQRLNGPKALSPQILRKSTNLGHTSTWFVYIYPE